MGNWTLDPDRLFSPEPSRRSAARDLYEEVRDLPLVCPHGHVPPQLHIGSFRNHNEHVFARFGPDAGADISVGADWGEPARSSR